LRPHTGLASSGLSRLAGDFGRFGLFTDCPPCPFSRSSGQDFGGVEVVRRYGPWSWGFHHWPILSAECPLRDHFLSLLSVECPLVTVRCPRLAFVAPCETASDAPNVVQRLRVEVALLGDREVRTWSVGSDFQRTYRIVVTFCTKAQELFLSARLRYFPGLAKARRSSVQSERPRVAFSLLWLGCISHL
jgi:hypothetical protein